MNMKKSFILSAVAAVVAALFCACTPDKPAEVYIPKNTVEFAGNAFSSFSLGADVKLYSIQNPDDKSEWTMQAVVPVRKEMSAPLPNLSINLVPLDDRGVRVRDGWVLEAEDLDNLIPVYNAGVNVERTIVFSIADEDKKYLSASEVNRLLENIKGVRMDFNVTVPDLIDQAAETAAAIAATVASTVSSNVPAPAAPAAAPKAPKAPTEYPMTLDGLCRKHGIYGMLSQYDKYLRAGNKKAAKQVEDKMWEIEKRVKNDKSIPESLRNSFVRYIEDKEDEIEDRY